MGFIDQFLNQARNELVVKPIVSYLRSEAQKNADVNKAAANPAGVMIHDQLAYGSQYAQYGSTRSKPGSSVDYVTLRRFSEQYDVARAVVNRRKRQLNSLQWEITPVDPEQKADPKLIRKIRDQVDDIGGYKVRFRELIDKMVEDLLVLDALAIYKRPNRGGGVYSLEVVDASTIQLRTDLSGNTPMPPEIAYRQVIRGTEMATFTADEMYYEMLNPRSSSPYGLSPLESLILVVSTALKSDLYNMHMLTEGNIPEGFYSVPETWQPDQIKEFQELWDAALGGDSRATSRLKFTPPGSYQPTMKPDDMRYKELQEWLMKKTCMLYEIQPQELGFTDTVNRSTGEVQESIQERSGLMPLVRFFEEIFEDVIQIDLGYVGYKLKFMGLEADDSRERAETNQIRIFSGQATVDEIRQEEGKEPLGIDKPMIVGGAVTFIDEESVARRNAAADALINMGSTTGEDAGVNGGDGGTDPAKTPTDQNGDGVAAGSSETQALGEPATKSIDSHMQLVTELRAFRKYAINRKKLGKSMRPFVSEVLPETAVTEMNSRLEKAADVGEVRQVFNEYMKDYQINFLAEVADLKSNLSKVLG